MGEGREGTRGLFFLFLLISFFSFSVSVFSGGDGAASKGPESRDGREPRRLLGVGSIVVSSGGDTIWPRGLIRRGHGLVL